MKKMILAVIAAITVALCFSGCTALTPEKNGEQSSGDQSVVSQSSEEKTSRKPVTPITDGSEFNWNS